jgi:hypothetical protein
VIAESKHVDNREVRRYRELAAASIARHGGRCQAALAARGTKGGRGMLFVDGVTARPGA